MRVALLVLLAGVGGSLLRPWDGGVPGAPDRGGAAFANANGGGAGPAIAGDAHPASTPASPGPAATAAPRPTPGPGEIACAEGVWRVVSLERLGGWTVRSSIPAAARAARSPLDPAIGAVTLQSPAILKLGVCSPDDPRSASRGGGPMRILRAWRLDRGTATPFSVVAAGGGRAPDLAILYGAAPVGGPGAGTWPVGTFVVELGPPGEAAVADVNPSPRWFMGLVVRLPG